jgi:hypothetical protein
MLYFGCKRVLGGCMRQMPLFQNTMLGAGLNKKARCRHQAFAFIKIFLSCR